MSNARTVGVLVLAIIVGGAVFVACRPGRDTAAASATITLRVAHWQLETGVREAFEEAARSFEKLHPGVRVSQLPIPQQIYSNWAMTQLVGETAPDIMQIGTGTSAQSANLPRFFVPLTAAVEEPNPYNKGTSLEAIRWRNTFLDGLESSYDAYLFELYGISPFGASVRVYYNRSLLRRITGSDTPPRTYADLLALAAQVREYSRASGRFVVPMAGSRSNAPMLMNQLQASQTQRVGTDLNRRQRFPISYDAFYLELLTGRTDLRQPGLFASFELMREVAALCPPGFMQLSRDDAMLMFVQERALMVLSGSWDASSLRLQAPFDIDVIPLPKPGADHPRYGGQILGPVAEAGVVGGVGVFGVTRASRHPDLAVDFLRFLTSQEANQKFSQTSGWLPVIVDVEPPDFMRGFAPNTEGYPPGPMLRQMPDVTRWLENHLHLLFSPDGSVERFLDAAEPSFRTALRSDLEREQRNLVGTVLRNDVALEVAQRQLAHAPNDPLLTRKAADLVEAQNDTEATAAYMSLRMQRAPR